ncbi:hypothetical protein CWI37_0097p0020 [Hamiltosporidium tvaerminnensis]|uniref:Uncharacterized protein n=1 Tax=Hamiltosporidium tvaerminnensis TaxID=1176355 RepID=A0A4Q9LD62_9MICR|nr:hypothetical protein CWI37_0097p0020 [Hamiltosporidium tvaerminnensis]
MILNDFDRKIKSYKMNSNNKETDKVLGMEKYIIATTDSKIGTINFSNEQNISITGDLRQIFEINHENINIKELNEANYLGKNADIMTKTMKYDISLSYLPISFKLLFNFLVVIYMLTRTVFNLCLILYSLFFHSLLILFISISLNQLLIFYIFFQIYFYSNFNFILSLFTVFASSSCFIADNF